MDWLKILYLKGDDSMLINVNNTIPLMNSMYKKNVPFLPKVIYLFNRVVYACDIRPNKNVDSSVIFPHNALGCVIHHNAKIDRGTKILHNVTIGGNLDKRRIYNDEEIDCAVIGKNVLIGVGAIIIGPVIIGDNVTIGAGAIITKDVPANSTVFGMLNNVIK